jgi:hypothetical protein
MIVTAHDAVEVLPVERLRAVYPVSAGLSSLAALAAGTPDRGGPASGKWQGLVSTL